MTYAHLLFRDSYFAPEVRETDTGWTLYFPAFRCWLSWGMWARFYGYRLPEDINPSWTRTFLSRSAATDFAGFFGPGPVMW